LATHKSAEKRMRQNEERRKRNVSIRTHVKTRIKAGLKALKAFEEKDLEKSSEALVKAKSVIAKASSKGILHKNNAARKISRLTRKINALG